MKHIHFTVEHDGMNASYYAFSKQSQVAIIVMLGDDTDDFLPKLAVKFFHSKKINVLTMSPNKKEYGHHSYPIERFGTAITYLKGEGNNKIGILGASTTGMLALLAASYYPEITLTIALSPADFVMEGFYQDNLDGMKERPGENESSVTYQGVGLPYLPYAYRHPDYWKNILKESKESKNKIACIKLFEESERRHPLTEEELIKVEKIKGHIVCIGCEDDCLWNTVKYIKRMSDRLKAKEHGSTFTMIINKYGTHFAFPASMIHGPSKLIINVLTKIMFDSGKKHPKECIDARKKIDLELMPIIDGWSKE